MNVSTYSLFLVAIGGAFGSVIRYLFVFIQKTFLPLQTFPIATLVVNLLGSFLIGSVLARADSDTLRALLIFGFLGGFTTFSSFSAENLNMRLNGKVLSSIFYITASTAGGILLAYLGYIAFKN